MNIRTRMIRLLMMCLWLGVSVSVTLADTPPPPPDNLPEGTVYEGWLSVIYGDPEPGSGQTGRELVFLADNQGNRTLDLAVEAESVIDLSGQYVEVIGEPSEVQAQDAIFPSIQVENIREIAPPAGSEAGVLAAVTGSQPFINLLCRFPDIPGIMNPQSYYTPLFVDTYPSVNNFWESMSYGNVDLDGTTTIPNWLTLPRPSTAYKLSNGSPNLNLLAQDCAALADATVNFLPYVGIHIMLNAGLDCCAYGGSLPLTLDAVNRNYRMTWLPPWSQVYGTLSHETGHALGLPHSSGPSWNPPSALEIYVSYWDVMSDSSGDCATFNAIYKCTPPGTIAYHVDKAGWIPSNRKISIFPGTTTNVTLEQLRTLPASNYVLAKVLIDGSSSHFYTVEVRTGTAGTYDASTPATTPVVIIHDVDIYRTGNAGHALVVDIDGNNSVNDAGAMWTVGETFTENNISISVTNLTGSTYTVNIANNSTPSPYPNPPSNLTFTGATATSINLEWTDEANNEDEFRLYRYTGSWVQIKTIPASAGVGNVVSTSHSSLDCGQGNYYLVRAYKAPYLSTNTDFVYAENTPCVPTLLSPPNGDEFTANPNLVWTMNGYYSSFDLRLDDNPSPTTIYSNLTPLYNNGFAYKFPTPLTVGTYFWQVRTVNSFGVASAWSSVRNFVIASPPAAAPVIYYDRTGTPTLRWNHVSWATGYWVQLDNSTTFAAPYSFEAANLPSDQLSVAVTPALTDGVYYMRVCARKVDNTCGGWSATEAIVVDVP